MVETATALKELIDAGKIRAWGLSNETTWGVSQWIRISDELGLPRPASIQNQFCLLNRSFESELAEACAPSNGSIGLLPWSVLAGGVLSGKFLGKGLDDPSLKGTRMQRFPSFMARFLNPGAVAAVQKYAAVAKEADMSLATLAQAFCKTRWFIPSTIIGATSLEQLKQNIDAFEVELDEKTLAKLDQIHNECLDPICSA